MAASRYTFRIHYQFLITARFLHLGRTPQKKQYKYDLDNLIAWKKETTNIFGSVRKPTKTGKLKKTKKCLDPQAEENLQILGAISNSRDNYLNTATAKNTCSKICSLDKPIISDDTILPYPHSSGLIPIGRQAEGDKSLKGIKDLECSMTEHFCDIPDDALVSSLMPYDAEPILEESITFDDGNKCERSLYSDRASNHDIVIQKISPIPTVTPALRFRSANPVNRILTNDTCEDVRKLALNHSNEIVNTMSSENVIPMSGISATNNAESFTKSKNSKNSKVTQKNSFSKIKEVNSDINSDARSEDHVEKKLTTTELFIPKMKPIPLGAISYASSNPFPLQTGMSSASSLKLSVTNAVQNLPFEPPESFEVISKIPMLPKESNDWQKRLDSHIFDAFKMDVEQMSLRAYPSVKTILSKTMPDLNRFFLNRWREGKVKELGEEGFKKLQEETIRKGVNLHANIMECLSGKPVSELQIMPENEGHWLSLKSGLAAVSGVRALEMEISHSMLMYRGVFDCLARYKDLLCMIDWKTSKKPRPLLKNTYDDPVQIAAYIGALNSSDAYVEQYGQVNHGLIVVAYPDGSPAHIHVMNRSVCEQHWQNWTERLYNYYQLIYTEKMGAKVEKMNEKNVMSRLGAT